MNIYLAYMTMNTVVKEETQKYSGDSWTFNLHFSGERQTINTSPLIGAT